MVITVQLNSAESSKADFCVDFVRDARLIHWQAGTFTEEIAVTVIAIVIVMIVSAVRIVNATPFAIIRFICGGRGIFCPSGKAFHTNLDRSVRRIAISVSIVTFNPATWTGRDRIGVAWHILRIWSYTITICTTMCGGGVVAESVT